MASTYSPLLRVELIGTGDQSGTWGTTTNSNLGTILEDAIAGTASINVTSGNVTLTSVDGGADQSRCMILNVSGTPGTTRNIVAPATSKIYVVINDSDGSVVLKTSSSTGLTITSGENVVTAFDGSDFVSIASNFSDSVVTLSGTQTLTNKTLTSPKIGTAILDVNGNEVLTINAAGAAVNDLVISNAATTNAPSLTAAGSDTNIDISLAPKGTGIVRATNTFSDVFGKIRGVPRSGGAKVAPYTLALTDVGLYIQVESGGSIVIPDSTFVTGDAVSIFNNSSSNITINCSIATAYVAGVDTDRATITLSPRGVATVLFISGNICVVSGNVS